ncbi:MAG: cytochrome c [Gammaproteobacteria bacterium]|jgi:cytochrome c556
MKASVLTALLVAGSLYSGSADAGAAGDDAREGDIRLAPELFDLLRAEMRAISSGVQGIALSLATADWEAIQATSARIRASYLMEQQLTPAQTRELQQALPDRFRQLDREFHQRAERLGAAAAAQDPERVAFQFSRLLESCARCHSAYAGSRFPGFAAPAGQDHQHGAKHAESIRPAPHPGHGDRTPD